MRLTSRPSRAFGLHRRPELANLGVDPLEVLAALTAQPIDPSAEHGLNCGSARGTNGTGTATIA